MAAGDTIAGSIRVVREDTEGNRNVVLGPVSQSSVDGKNGGLGVEEKLYVNTMRSDRVQAPLQAKEIAADAARFFPGESFFVQHLSASLEEASDSDAADAFEIHTLKQDKNTGRVFPTVLTEADNEITGNPATSTSEWVDIYQETVPDRQEFRLVGEFLAGAYENA